MKPSSNIDISVLLADILSVPSMYYLYVRYLCQDECMGKYGKVWEVYVLHCV